MVVTLVVTQGRRDSEQWTSAYFLAYSTNGVTWRYVTDDHGFRRAFVGNDDRSGKENRQLDGGGVIARYVRVYPISWYGAPALRWELKGCAFGEC